jgi:hypothetical protein
MHIFQDGSRKRLLLGSAESIFSPKFEMRNVARRTKALKKGSNLRARVNGKALIGSFRTMNFLGSPDEIHSA